MTKPVTNSMAEVAFACPECRLSLSSNNGRLCCANGHSFGFSQGVYNLLPSSVDLLALEDAEYHATQKDVWLDGNQLTAYRNVYFHESVLRTIVAKSNSSSRILEVGGGVGFDLHLFLRMSPGPAG